MGNAVESIKYSSINVGYPSNNVTGIWPSDAIHIVSLNIGQVCGGKERKSRGKFILH